MSNNALQIHPGNSLLVPAVTDFSGIPASYRNQQQGILADRRRRFLHGIRGLAGVKALADVARPSDLYRVVSPAGAVLQKGKDGTFASVIRRSNGKIEKHVKFEQMTPGVAQLATVIGTQVMLVSIAMQLNEIQDMLDTILDGLHTDRTSRISAARHAYEQALTMRGEDNRRGILLTGIQDLNYGIESLVAELNTGIANLPSERNSFWDNLGISKSSRIAKVMPRLQDSLRVILEGISLLAQCYAAMDEPEAARNGVSGHLKRLYACDLGAAARRARFVGPKNGIYPEQVFENTTGNRDGLMHALQMPAASPVVIEVTGRELKGLPGTGNNAA